MARSARQYQTYAGRRRGRVAPRRRPAPALALILLLSILAAFAFGFVVFWSLGTNLAQGRGFSFRWPTNTRVSAVVVAEKNWQAYPFLAVPPVVDLRPMRDLAYVPVKGIYVTSWTAGIDRYVDNLIALCDRTELNAMVIDVKDATGYVSYAADVGLVRDLKLWERRIPDLSALLAKLRQHRIVPIARIVCFNDPLLAKKRPDLAVQHKDGGIWKDRYGSSYTNPYSKEVWDYLVQLAEDAVRRGFREIQFDYVRFPTDGVVADARFPGAWGQRDDAIAAFLQYARERIHALGAWVSADVFGHALDHRDDAGIGQRIEKLCQSVDIVCPMIYPSHYEPGSYNLKNPDTSPYETVNFATRDATRRFAGNGALYRPWLQDFAYPTPYGVAEVKAQIQAVEQHGYTEWLLWDPDLKYTEGALRAASQ